MPSVTPPAISREKTDISRISGSVLVLVLFLLAACLLLVTAGGDVVDDVPDGSELVDGGDTLRSTEAEKDVLTGDAVTEASCTDGDDDEGDDDDNDLVNEEVMDDIMEDDIWLFQYDPIEIGYVQEVEVEDGMVLQMKTLAINPPIFEIRNFLSPEECDHLMTVALERGLHTSQTIPDDAIPDEAGQESMIEYFRELDGNEDGLLDASELLGAISQFTMAEDVDLTPEHVKELIELKLDKDADGVIDIDEFILADTPAMEEEINEWLVEIGNVGETEAKRSQARVSDQAWLDQWTTDDEVLLRLQERVIRLTLLPSTIIQTSEHLQVVRYHPGGHYHAHYDSNELDDKLECAHTYGIEDDDDDRKIRHSDDFSEKRLCRLATILYYLNDVEEGGETAFPVADNETFTQESLDATPYDIYDLSNNCHKSNVVVPPERGKAIMWYNHYLDEEEGWIGENRNHSLHGGCDVISGAKWIANNWITVDDQVHRQILYQKRYFADQEPVISEDTRALLEEIANNGGHIRQAVDGLSEDDGYDSEAENEDVRSDAGSSFTEWDADYDSADGEKRDDKSAVDLNEKSQESEASEKDISHRKARDKLNESNKKSNLFSSTQGSGVEFHASDEL